MEVIFINTVLILSSVVIFICIFLNKMSNKLGIPVLLAFILLGMLFGSDGIMRIHFDNYAFAEQICSVALVFIMFYGGFGTNWRTAKPVAVKSILLSTAGVVLTAALTGGFCYFILKMNIMESILIGSLLSSTDAASVFSVLRSRKLNLKYNTASMLELESGSNDPCAYMLTALTLEFMKKTPSAGAVAYMIFAQIFYGFVIGIVIALTASFTLRKVKFSAAGFDTVFVFSTAIIAYALPMAVGGNGYLSTYIAGIILGNSNISNKKSLVPFFDGINGLMQMLIFFLLGLLSFPSKLPEIMPVSLLIAVFITFVARPAAIFAILAPFKSKISQMLMVSWAGLRGAASIVFSVMAIMSVSTDGDIFHIIFCVVLFSIMIQGSLIPMMSEKLDMIDNESDVMKTFTDYSDEVPIQFIQFTINENHKWCGLAVSDITLPPDTILVLMIRDDKKIIPNGKTVFVNGDKVILSAKSTNEISDINLMEKTISRDDRLIGKSLSEIDNERDRLVIMIQRNDEIIIPNGSTIIMENDVLVINF